ncbi:MAG: hypothetical protein MJ033_05375 [Victivallaceae bacterium]|nr:hypothetical protein [Victivallaceae bacterium]
MNYVRKNLSRGCFFTWLVIWVIGWVVWDHTTNEEIHTFLFGLFFVLGLFVVYSFSGAGCLTVIPSMVSLSYATKGYYPEILWGAFIILLILFLFGTVIDRIAAAQNRGTSWDDYGITNDFAYAIGFFVSIWAIYRLHNGGNRSFFLGCLLWGASLLVTMFLTTTLISIFDDDTR